MIGMEENADRRVAELVRKPSIHSLSTDYVCPPPALSLLVHRPIRARARALCTGIFDILAVQFAGGYSVAGRFVG